MHSAYQGPEVNFPAMFPRTVEGAVLWGGGRAGLLVALHRADGAGSGGASVYRADDTAWIVEGNAERLDDITSRRMGPGESLSWPWHTARSMLAACGAGTDANFRGPARVNTENVGCHALLEFHAELPRIRCLLERGGRILYHLTVEEKAVALCMGQHSRLGLGGGGGQGSHLRHLDISVVQYILDLAYPVLGHGRGIPHRFAYHPPAGPAPGGAPGAPGATGALATPPMNLATTEGMGLEVAEAPSSSAADGGGVGEGGV